MKLEIISPQHVTTYDIVWAEIETPTGSRIIQPEHAPMISLLSQDKKIIFCLSTGEEKSLSIANGIARITRDSITILVTNKL